MPESTDIDTVIIKLPRWLQGLIVSFGVALGYQTLAIHDFAAIIPVVNNNTAEIKDLRERQIRYSVDAITIQEIRAKIASVEADIVHLKVEIAKLNR